MWITCMMKRMRSRMKIAQDIIQTLRTPKSGRYQTKPPWRDHIELAKHTRSHCQKSVHSKSAKSCTKLPHRTCSGEENMLSFQHTENARKHALPSASTIVECWVQIRYMLQGRIQHSFTDTRHANCQESMVWLQQTRGRRAPTSPLAAHKHHKSMD